MTNERLSVGEKRLCEWQAGLSGGFHTKLWDLISAADSANLARLSLGFKEEVDAYLKFSRVPGYWDALESAWRRERAGEAPRKRSNRMKELSNETTSVRLNDESKDIFVRDLVDRINEPAFYNTTKRSYRKAKEAIEKAWNEKTTFREVWDIVSASGLQTHYWCMMD